MKNTMDQLKSLNQMPPDRARKRVNEILQNGELTCFIQKICTNGATTVPANYYFPVAHVNLERLLNFGYEINTSSIVLLSIDTILRHPRFQDYNFENWSGIQELVDVGDWKVSKPHHRMIWGYLNERPWALVLKKSNKGELFMVTYHRIQERVIAKLHRENKGSGGPQPPHGS